MPNSWSSSNRFVAINRFQASIATTLKGEEQLVQVQPSTAQPTRSPSPPASKINDFPSLLECLASGSRRSNMPNPTAFRDNDQSLDDNDQSLDDYDLFTSNEFPFTPPSGQSLKEKNSDKSELQQRIDELNEIEKDLLRDDYERQDTVEGDSYSLSAILEEARSFYQTNATPEFCIKKPAQFVKQVTLSDTETVADIKFHTWSDAWGYWVLTDDVSDSYIVKHVNGRYFVWEGVGTKFAKEPAAYVLKQHQKPDSRRAQKLTPSKCEPRPNRAGSLRPRSARQSMPYTMYDIQKKYDNKGVRLTEAELEDAVIELDTSPTKKSVSRSKKRKPVEASTIDSESNCSHNLNTFGMVSPSMSISVSDEYLLSNTILRTRFHGFEGATIPILAEKCPSNESFFKTIKTKWSFKLIGQQLMYCIASFPWLSPDKNILLQEDDVDGFDTIMYEVRSAPVWHREGRAEVVVEVFAA